MKLPSKSIVLALTLPAVAVGGWALLRTPAPSAPSAAAASASGPAGEAPPTTPEVERAPGCRFTPDTTLAYTLTASVEARTGVTTGGKPGGEIPNLKRDASSTLDLRVLSADDRGAVLAGRYRDVDAVLGDMAQPFLVRIGADCGIAGFARLATSSLVSARAAQAMTANLVFASGPAQADGANDYGAFRANYKRIANRIERRIQGYTRVWSEEWSSSVFEVADPKAGKARQAQAPKESYLGVELGAGPWFASLSGTERVAIFNTELTSQIKAKQVTPPPNALADVPRDEAAYVWEDLLHRRLKQPTALRPPETEAEKKQIAELATLAPSTAMAQYRSGLAAGEDFSGAWRKLSRYLEVRPEAAGAIAQEIRQGQLPEDGSAGVFMALGNAQTTEARDALLAIKNDTGVGPFDRSRSVFALVGRPDVGVDFARSLRSESQAITTGDDRSTRLYARHAALALGVMGALRAEEPGIVSEASGVVMDILARGRTDIALRPAFGAAANLGDPKLLAVVTPYLRSPDAKIRRAATVVVRRMPPATTRELTNEVLRTETDAEVRRDLYHTVYLQHLDARVTPDRNLVLSAIDDLLHTRPQGLTRQSIVHLLGAAQKDYPEAHAALIAAVPLEAQVKDEGILELMTQYLSGDEIAAALAGQP